MSNLDTALFDIIQKLDEMQKTRLLAFVQSILGGAPSKRSSPSSILELSVEERLERAKKSFGTINSKLSPSLDSLRRENIYGDDER